MSSVGQHSVKVLQGRGRMSVGRKCQRMGVARRLEKKEKVDWK